MKNETVKGLFSAGLRVEFQGHPCSAGRPQFPLALPRNTGRHRVSLVPIIFHSPFLAQAGLCLHQRFRYQQLPGEQAGQCHCYN